jgi:hypothetical protein
MSSHRLAHLCGQLAAVVLASSLAAGADATTTASRGLDDLVQAADVVVIGRAVGAEYVRTGRNVYTRYRIAVDEALLGTAESELTIVVPGGVDRSGPHPVRHSMVDAPVLMHNAPVALMLTRGGPFGTRDHQIVGLDEGAIALDEAAGRSELSSRAGATTSTRADQLRTRLHQLVAARSAGAARTQAGQPTRPALPRGIDPGAARTGK